MISIFTTVKDAEKRGDNIYDAIACYDDLADEVIVVDGKKTWPQEFDWKIIGEHFQYGYEQAQGDWVIHADLDFIFHENNFDEIRQACMANNDQPALSFWKYQFILPDRYNIKSRLVIAVNKGKFGDRIRFDSGGDLCQPSLDGKYISPNDVPEARVPFYNYEKMTKNQAQVADDVGRMERAYKRFFGKSQYGSDGSDKSALELWIQAQQGKFSKPQKHIPLKEHPKYVQETIFTLKPDQWGYNGFNKLERNDYAQGSSSIG